MHANARVNLPLPNIIISIIILLQNIQLQPDNTLPLRESLTVPGNDAVYPQMQKNAKKQGQTAIKIFRYYYIILKITEHRHVNN